MDVVSCIVSLSPVLGSLVFGSVVGGAYVYRHSFRALLTVLRTAGVYLLLLRKYKVFLAVALLTTFEESMQSLKLAWEGEMNWLSFGSVLLSESGSKFLAAAGYIGRGLGGIVDWVSGGSVCGWVGDFGLLLNGLYSIWVGVAAIYLLLFLYEVYRGRWQKAEVDKHEQLLVVTILFLLTAVLHGSGVLEALFSNSMSLVDTLTQVWGDKGLDTPTNVNASTNTST